MDEPLEIICSARRTLALQLRPDGRLIVRAPMRTSERRIREFVAAHAAWIEKHRAKLMERAAQASAEKPLTAADVRALAERAKEIIPARAAYFAPMVGVRYTGITIRNQRTRWGSCSAKGRLNFNCLLMLTPPEVLDSVVVHELCHLLEPNHSKRFYAEVLRVLPDYRKWDAWLKENGPRLIRRMTGE